MQRGDRGPLQATTRTAGFPFEVYGNVGWDRDAFLAAGDGPEFPMQSNTRTCRVAS